MNGIVNPKDVVDFGFITGVDEEDIQPNSIDLRVENVYTINGPLVLFANKENQRQLPEYSPLRAFSYPVDVELKNSVDMYRLEPGQRYQIEFSAKLDLPGNICGLTLVRSTMAKSGCSGENGLFDSGYQGACGMMVSVQAESYIEVGSSIAQMLFFNASSSKMYNGFYQGTSSPMEWS